VAGAVHPYETCHDRSLRRSAGRGPGRERLRAEGVSHWAVGVVEANEGATRLYERAGFRPFYREMLGRV